MSKSSKILIAVLAALLLGCGIFFLAVPRGGAAALIYLDGELFSRVELDEVSEAYFLPVGGGNELLIEPGRVAMHSADCPDQLCVKQGFASAAQPLVCLPNRVIVVIEGRAEDELDAVLGGGGG